MEAEASESPSELLVSFGLKRNAPHMTQHGGTWCFGTHVTLLFIHKLNRAQCNGLTFDLCDQRVRLLPALGLHAETG
jgi:hypothetical protein